MLHFVPFIIAVASPVMSKYPHAIRIYCTNQVRCIGFLSEKRLDDI